MKQVRSRCRNLKCRTKLAVPTDNHHKAFCTQYCYDQFYRLRCVVCEKDLPKEASRRTLCSSRKCRLDYRNFRPAYDFGLPPEPKCKTDSRSAHFTGLKSAIKGTAGPRIIAGPALSEFSLWAATLDPPKPRPMAESATRWHRQPGDIAAEWTARELARRELEDEQYVAADEARLATEPVSAPIF
jgi:hypothetical protein